MLYGNSRGKGGWDSGEIETVSKMLVVLQKLCGKGGWDSGEIETHIILKPIEKAPMWKGWMGLRRD